jgi:hypothetical protein
MLFLAALIGGGAMAVEPEVDEIFSAYDPMEPIVPDLFRMLGLPANVIIPFTTDGQRVPLAVRTCAKPGFPAPLRTPDRAVLPGRPFTPGGAERPTLLA